jgi:tetratricopeptide (TPR) repeat protein
MAKKNPKSTSKIEVLGNVRQFKSNEQTLLYWGFVLCAIIIYLPSINYGFVLDDIAVVEKNKFVHEGIGGISDILTTFYWKGYWDSNSGLYRPLSLIMFALEWQISPENPMIHHFINVVLFGLSIGGLYKLMVLLLPTSNRWIAVWIAVLFMLHPSHTEVVANIKSRDEILAFFFLIVLVKQLVLYLQKGNRKSYIYSILAYLLCLLSKEGAITFLPLIFLVFVVLYKQNWIQGFKNSVPFILLTLIWLALRHWVISSDAMAPISYSYLDNSLVSCSGYSQFTTGLGLFCNYFCEILLPLKLSYDYSYNEIPCIPFLSIPVFSALLILTGMISIFIRTWKTAPVVAFSSAFFLITIALITNVFFLIGTTYANRLTYIPSLGIIILLVIGSEYIIKQFRSSFFHVLLAIIALSYGVITINRIPVWESNDSLFEADAMHAKRSARVHFNYGTSLMKRSENSPSEKTKLLNSATVEFKTALKIDSLELGSLINLGVCYYRLEAYELSIRSTLKALSLSKTDTLLYGNLGDAYFSGKQYALAIKAYVNICNSKLVNDTYLNKLGTSYFQETQYPQAISAFERGLKRAPKNLEIKLNLANAYGASGQFRMAARLFEEIYRSNPSNTNVKRLLKITLEQLGDIEKIKSLELD